VGGWTYRFSRFSRWVGGWTYRFSRWVGTLREAISCLHLCAARHSLNSICWWDDGKG
jgi:hypothetical protein